MQSNVATTQGQPLIKSNINLLNSAYIGVMNKGGIYFVQPFQRCSCYSKVATK